MSDDLTQIKGVGPARSEYLVEAGYEEYTDIGQADHEELADSVDVPADTALEMVVQSQNLAEEQDASVEESEPEPGTISEELDEALDDVEESKEERLAEGYQERAERSGEAAEAYEQAAPEPEPESEPEPEVDDGKIRFEITFENEYAYDTFYQSLVEQKLDLLRANRKGQNELDGSLEQMRAGTPETGVTLSVTEAQLNDLHNCIRQNIIEYKGGNLIEHMDALQTVMDQIDSVRSEELF